MKITRTFDFDDIDIERILDLINIYVIEDEDQPDIKRLGIEELKGNSLMWKYFWEEFFRNIEELLIEETRAFIADDGFKDILKYR